MAAEDDDVVLPVAEPLAGVSLADAPILFFVYFHKALRAELAQLHRQTVAASEAAESGSHDREVVLELQQRFEFLKLVYKYHCATEDEVIFLALDVHVKNVAGSYALEHESNDELFDSVFHCLNVLLEEKSSVSKAFQELISSIRIIQTSVCQHMLKEEEQVFPLLVQQFSSKEQGSLVWQFICSVPVMVIEEFFPWMISYVSPEEQGHITQCIKEIVPREKLLQEVVVSWLGNNHQASSGSYTRAEKGIQCSDGSADTGRILKLASKWSFSENWKRMKACCVQRDIGHNPIDCLHLWHGAIMEELKEILEELYQLRRSSSFSDLDSVIIRIKFLADVLSFYSNALEKFFYPVINQLASCRRLPSTEEFPCGSQIEGLQLLLQYSTQNDIPLCKFMENLGRELKSFVSGVGKHFAFQEREVFPTISKNCSHEMQLRLLYMSLNTMPLGLLKSAITWFSAHLSENESRSILNSIKQGDSFVNNSLASLLKKWFQLGYSGKTSTEKFREDLQKVFKRRFSSQSKKIKETSGPSFVHSDMQLLKGSDPRPTEGRNFSPSSSCPHTANKYGTLYSSAINLHLLFPRTIKKVHPFSKFPGGKSCSSSIINAPKPVDLIFFFHKALKKDLDYLVFASAQLANNVGLVLDFRQRFQLIHLLFQTHSDAEDEIAFPALEAKGKVQNISRSHTIDHKLEVEHFSKISLILEKIYELRVSVSSVAPETQDQRIVKHHQLCRNLHNMCKSMHSVLSNHIHREEVELWSLFRETFSIQEQEKIIGRMLGKTSAEVLQDMIPWLMASLTAEEQNAVMSLWRKTARNTMFDEWLGEWWEGYDTRKVEEESSFSPSWTADNPLEIISTYLSEEALDKQKQGAPETNSDSPQRDCVDEAAETFRNCNVDDREKSCDKDQKSHDCSECTRFFSDSDKKRCNEVTSVTNQEDKSGQLSPVPKSSGHSEHLLRMSQEDLEAAIRRVSRNSSLDLRKKSYIIQNLLMSRWIVGQKMSHSVSSNGEDIPGQLPSYHDALKLTFGCQHYKRNCKLFAECCNQLYTCRHCHDEVADHSIDRKSITRMMCMRCLKIQPIGPNCSAASCDNFSMARYYCKICKLFDDEREIYHCPYCNLCRLGKGLGIDYFHCMNCNACMSRSLSAHICREKCLEDNCPICHEYIFTSSSPVKALPCGHIMHSTCFRDYTCSHYTCPICSKSLGDMQVYFGMLDALLAEEKIPVEYAGKTQVILCNDCEKRGPAPFHWLHHKCSYCGSYNTRLL